MIVRSTSTVETDSDWDLSVEATERLRECFVLPAQWHCVDGMTFDQAADLLDFLEIQAVSKRQVQMQDDGLLTVRWFR